MRNRLLYSSSPLHVPLSWTSSWSRAISLPSVFTPVLRRRNGKEIPDSLLNVAAHMPHSINRYTAFKNFEKRILVATDIFGRGIDVERVNIVVNYDCPSAADSYLHRVG